MTPVKTRILQHDPANGQWGDCRRAAFASIFDLLPDDVPHFHHGGDGDAARLAENAWLAERGLALFVVPISGNLAVVLPAMERNNPGIYYLLCGMSALGSGHCVVGCGGRIVHDPSGAGIAAPLPDGNYRFDFFTPFFDASHIPSTQETTIMEKPKNPSYPPITPPPTPLPVSPVPTPKAADGFVPIFDLPPTAFFR